MFDFIKAMQTRKQKQKQKATDDFARYADLVRRGASGRKLNATESDELAELADGLGLSVEAVAMHAEAVANWTTDRQHADQLASLKRQHDEAVADAEKIAADGQRQLAELQQAIEARRDAARGKVSPIAAKVKAAAAAQERVDAIEREHWRLFGHADPAIAKASEAARQAIESRRRRIVRDSEENRHQHGDSPNVLYFERILGTAPGFDPAAMEDVEFVPVEGQTQADVDELVSLVRLSRQPGKNPVRFLLNRTTANSADAVTMFVRLHLKFVDEWQPNDDPARYRFVPAVGQSRRELERCIDKITAAHDEWKSHNRSAAAAAAS